MMLVATCGNLVWFSTFIEQLLVATHRLHFYCVTLSSLMSHTCVSFHYWINDILDFEWKINLIDSSAAWKQMKLIVLLTFQVFFCSRNSVTFFGLLLILTECSSFQNTAAKFKPLMVSWLDLAFLNGSFIYFSSLVS